MPFRPVAVAVAVCLLSSSLRAPTARAAVACDEAHDECASILFQGSACESGRCTNPFAGGCLRAMLEGDDYRNKYGNSFDADSEGGGDGPSSASNPALASTIERLLSSRRVCNSEDDDDPSSSSSSPPSAPVCSPNANEYVEVRVASQNWEGAFVVAWMLQILYSELLGVPSTIESGKYDATVNFYDSENRMEFGTNYDYEMMRRASEAPDGDCTVCGKDEGDYETCGHIMPEIWFPNQGYYDLYEEGKVEPLQFVGVVGEQTWHITQYTVANDSSLATYFGLQRKENRRKLAETFKRPTRWIDYCAQVSPTNCTAWDGVASRPPAKDGSEDGRYFHPEGYDGHFRYTDKNDCDGNVDCTGHFMDYPCGWTSFLKQQTRHLDIALESDGNETSGGYAYGEMVDIWKAANKTKSDLIGLWWAPEPTVDMFKSAGSDLFPVMLPRPTQECVEHRIDTAMRCDVEANEFDIYGDEKGACGEPDILIQKVASNMQETIGGSKNPKARMSPAYDAYKSFSLTVLQQQEILTAWAERGKDRANFDLRYATCKWMADNLEHIVESFVPADHPLTFVEESTTTPATIVALLFSAVAIVVSSATTFGIVRLHSKRLLGRAAQIEFLSLLLAGIFLASIGSLLLAVPPSDGTCVTAAWLNTAGYTLQMVPTIIRVYAIIVIVRASKKMKFVKVEKKKLLKWSVGLTSISILYCAIWTGLDPPKPQISLVLGEEKNEYGETVVESSLYCDSDSSLWFYIMFVSQALLLVCASLFAWQMRSVPNSVNDSKELAVMIYSSSVFLMLRFLCYILERNLSENSFGKSSLQKARSIIIAVDQIASVVIFFSRFFTLDAQKTQRRGMTQSQIGQSQLVSTVSIASQFTPAETMANRRLSVIKESATGMPSIIPPGADQARAHRLSSLSYGADQAEDDMIWLRQDDEENSTAKEERIEEKGDKEENNETSLEDRLNNNESIAVPKWILEMYGKWRDQET